MVVRRAQVKIIVDGKEKEKKKTFPPEVGVLTFLDSDGKALPTTETAGGGEGYPETSTPKSRSTVA